MGRKWAKIRLNHRQKCQNEVKHGLQQSEAVVDRLNVNSDQTHKFRLGADPGECQINAYQIPIVLTLTRITPSSIGLGDIKRNIFDLWKIAKLTRATIAPIDRTFARRHESKSKEN